MLVALGGWTALSGQLVPSTGVYAANFVSRRLLFALGGWVTHDCAHTSRSRPLQGVV